MQNEKIITSFRLDTIDLEWLKEYANKNNTKVSTIIQDIIKDFIQKRNIKDINDFNSIEEYKDYLYKIVMKSPINKYIE